MRHLHPQHKLAPVSLAIALALTGPAIVHAQPADSVRAMQISITSQSLESALNELSALANIPIAFSPSLVAGKTAPEVKGNLTLRQALNQLLSGSGLSTSDAGNSIVIRNTRSTSDQGSLLPTIQVTAQRVRDRITEGSASYAASAATIAKGNQRLKDIPQSVSVMTRQRIEDQNLTTLDEVLQQTTGMTFGRSSNAQGEGRSSTFFARGYQVENYMINGAPVNSGGGWAGDTLINGSSGIYDRVEVLRGAAGLLVGNGQPGAVVNLERKRPLEQNQISLLLSAGSWDKYRGEVDVSRVLTHSGNVRGRMVVSYENSDRFWKLTNSENPLVYGVLDIDLTDRTTLSFGGLYEKYRETGRWGRIVEGAGLFPEQLTHMKRSDNPAGRDWTYYDLETKEYFATLEHHFNDRWKSKTNLTHQTQTSEFLVHSIFLEPGGAWPNYTLRAANGLQVLYRKPSDVTNIALDSNIVGEFDLFGKTHELVFGANWFNTESSLYTNIYSPWRDRHNTVIDIRESINNTNYLPKPETPNARRGNPIESSRYGLYSTLRLTLTDPLKLILGARLSYYDYEQRHWETGIKTTDRHVDAELTPFFGVVYSLSDQWSVYASYADIFNPQFGQFTASGGSLDPVIGANYELGIKGELFDGALNTSLALFRIDETDRALVDPRWPDPKIEPCPGNPNGGVCHYNGGQRRSEGLEIEINGELLPGWQAGFGYTYNTTKVIKQRNNFNLPTDEEGRPFSSQTPRHLFKAWTSYRLSGDWRGLRIGGGVSAQSKSTGNWIWDNHTDPGRAVWSVFSAYDIDKTWSISANVNNLFDKKYLLTGSSGAGQWAEPRSINVSLRGQF